MKIIRELDQVVLAADIPEHGLRAGDVGTVVLVHGDNAGYEIEFGALDGETIAVVSVVAEQVRAIERHEIAHARPIGDH
jgi:hypothetical protein